MRICDLEHKKVAIWGLGREGRTTLSLLRTTLPDLKIWVLNDAKLPAKEATRIAEDPAITTLTGNKAALALPTFDVVVKSPGISVYRHEVQELKRRGGILTSATSLWFGEHPRERTVCITGTKGKSTTASLVAHLLRHSGLHTALGGNIGVPLLDILEEPSPDVWVIEMSSYQTSDFDGTPTIAVLLNLFPEHLDWHGDVRTYFNDKLKLLYKCHTAIIDAADDNIADNYRGRAVYFNHQGEIHAKGGHICAAKTRLLPIKEVPLRGEHNLSNVCAALTVARCLGLELKNCVKAVPSFIGLPHRLSLLGERNGIMYVDDSISTTPQSAIAALNSFGRHTVSILLGGFDRGLNWGELAQFLVTSPAFAVITMPETGPKIAERMKEFSAESGPSPLLYEAEDLDRAVTIAHNVTPRGGVVLLSPAAPSYGRFENFEQRGHAFAEAAGFAAKR